jgi:hypothetical protein
MPKKARTHHLKMAVLPGKPDDKKWSVIVADDLPRGRLFIQSATGRVMLHCGACNRPLMKLESTDQVHGGAWKCPDCGAYNTTIQ